MPGVPVTASKVFIIWDGETYEYVGCCPID